MLTYMNGLFKHHPHSWETTKGTKKQNTEWKNWAEVQHLIEFWSTPDPMNEWVLTVVCELYSIQYLANARTRAMGIYTWDFLYVHIVDSSHPQQNQKDMLLWPWG